MSKGEQSGDNFRPVTVTYRLNMELGVTIIFVTVFVIPDCLNLPNFCTQWNRKCIHCSDFAGLINWFSKLIRPIPAFSILCEKRDSLRERNDQKQLTDFDLVFMKRQFLFRRSVEWLRLA